jgi:hypothetical protein
MLAKAVKNRQRKPAQTHDGWYTYRKFINLPQQIEVQQQDPIVQGWFVVIKSAVQSWRDVIARELHFQRHQGTNAFVVNEGQETQIDQQGRKKQQNAQYVQ